MKVDYITYAIPVFLFLIAVEVIVSKVKKLGYYSYHDSVNDLSAGIFQQVVGVFSKFILAGLYILIYENYRFFTISGTSIIAWIVCFLAVDVAYYWFHRAAHESAVFWGSHLPHHQSEEYNLTVALRQGAVQGFFSTMFYFPLAFAGFPPVMFITLSQFNTIYQFWIHTKAIGKMGFLETFLNTPSHHRVHHGKNPMYIDKNYAGTLIIWDKMFGSFKEETEEVVFGTIKPLASWNPVWAQVHYFIELFQKSLKAPYFLDKIKVWFKGPGWLPRGMQYDQFMADPAYTEEGMKKGIQAKYPPKYKTTISRALNAYTVVQFFSILGFALVFLATETMMSLGMRLVSGAFVLVTLTAIGGIFESKRWAHILEIHRLFFAAIALLVNFEQGIWFALIPVAFAVIFYSLVFREPQTAQT